MPTSLSPDIRYRFQVQHREGLSGRGIGRRLLISVATAVRFAACLRRTGNLTSAANPLPGYASARPEMQKARGPRSGLF
jgi:transposase